MISERIAKLEKECAKRGRSGIRPHFQEDYHQAGLTQFAGCERWEKTARSMAYAIENMDVYTAESDRIGGRTYYEEFETPSQIESDFDEVTPGNLAFMEECPDMDELMRYYIVNTCIKGHITWFYTHILRLGTGGFKKKVEAFLAAAKDEKAVEFYKGVLIVLDAMQAFNDKHIPAYEALGNLELADRMRKVPRLPAETFREAVQAFYMQHIVVMKENPFGGNGPGRLDYYLWPYLERDLKKGICTMEEAKEIIDELFLRINERLFDFDIWVEAIVVGGTYPNGASAVNPLTYLMIESIIDLDITHPSVYVRLPENPPEDLVKLCARYMMSGKNRAQILYDPAVIGALTERGVPYYDAVDYACGGCMEIGIQGRSSDYLYAGWQNIPKIFELTLTGGVCLRSGNRINGFKGEKKLTDFTDFESFYQYVLSQIKYFVHLYLRKIDIYSAELEKTRPAYLISSMIDNCLEKGRNMHAGGAKYHDYGVAPVGLPNVADGLHAIKKAVFEDKLCIAEELMNALKADFAGYERLQQQLKAIPKYGVDDDEADAMAARLIGDVADIYCSYTTRWGGHGKAVIMTFVYSPVVAESIGATPDGRNAGSGVAYGTTPQCCAMTEGVTAAINSATKIPHEKIFGGASTMWDFDNAWANEEIIAALLHVFTEQGGQIFQGNTTSVADLIKAKENPEEYGHIVVRVGGYSARFSSLPPEMQEEIINRVRHSN